MIKGNNYCHVNTETNIGQVNGCTIYYPPSSGDGYNDLYYEWFYKSGKQQTLFAAHCSWKSFLLNYFKHDKKHLNKKNIL
jgi:hypothetical protein